MVTNLKKKWRLMNREEQTSVGKVLLMRLVVEAFGLIHQVRYFKLRGITQKHFKTLRNKRARNVFVFANGPSLNDLDFTKIKNLVDDGEFDLVVVNSFASKAIEKFGLTPTIGVFADPAHYGASDGHPLSNQFQADIDVMNEHGVPALVPYRFYNKSQFKTSVPYLGLRNIFRKNVTQLNRPVGVYGLTAFTALLYAITQNYKRIYICGYDNSYFKTFAVDLNNNKYFQDKHFYDKKESVKRDLPTDQYGPASHIFYDTYRHFRFLEKISRHGKKNVQIYNIAKETFTDAFPRCFDLDIYA